MKSTSTNSLKVAEILLTIGAVLFSRNKPFRFTSGILSPVYVDNRITPSFTKERAVVINALIKRINEIGKPDVIAGVATAGIPNAAFIAQKMNLPLIYVRPKPKEHGAPGNELAGKIKRGQKVIVIEDLISTGGSSVKAVEILRSLGARIVGVVAVYTHNLKEADNNFKKAKVKLTCLTNTLEVASVAEKKGLLKKEQIELIKSWVNDPKNWKSKKD